MEALTISGGASASFDWASPAWALLLAAITATCLVILRKFPRIAESGAAARVVAHVAIGYFGFGMLAFGVSSAVSRSLPVPGGVAWEGGVAVIGGIAACVIGGSTLVEHAVQVASMYRASRMARVPVTSVRDN